MKTSDIADHPALDGVIRHVEWGDTVRINFLVWLADGTMLDSSVLGGPLTFTTGERVIMQGIEEGIEELVIGMAVGESKTEMISTDRAFSPDSTDPSSHAPDRHLHNQQMAHPVRLALDGLGNTATVLRMCITGINGAKGAVDANHRLAGHTLILQLELLDILAPVNQAAREQSHQSGVLRT